MLHRALENIQVSVGPESICTSPVAGTSDKGIVGEGNNKAFTPILTTWQKQIAERSTGDAESLLLETHCYPMLLFTRGLDESEISNFQ